MHLLAIMIPMPQFLMARHVITQMKDSTVTVHVWRMRTVMESAMAMNYQDARISMRRTTMNRQRMMTVLVFTRLRDAQIP